MKQPNLAPEPQTNTKPNQSEQKRIKKAPTPQELISHYQSQGLDEQQASVKVIEDLQNVLVRFVSSNSARNKKDKLISDSSRKLDAVIGRLAVIDSKLDSKPGYAETFAVGVASGVALNGIGTVWPQVWGGLGEVWSAMRSVSNPSSSPSP